MAFIELSDKLQGGKKIMIFLEGTILKPKSFLTLYSHKSYIPIGNAVSLIRRWEEQGAEILYCTSRKKKQAEEMVEILHKYGFCGSKLYFRKRGKKYKDIIETVCPDILIEDDCKSIGGCWQMCITYVEPKIKNKITSVVIKEFSGIDNLPEDISLM